MKSGRNQAVVGRESGSSWVKPGSSWVKPGSSCVKLGSGQAVVVCVDSWQAVCWCGLDKDRAGTGQELGRI